MNPKFLGDSYDLVKRFFIHELIELRYEVAVDPFFTGDWREEENRYYRLIGSKSRRQLTGTTNRVALLLDPDTGVNDAGSANHVTYAQIAKETGKHTLVFAFDQSFAHNANAKQVMRKKLQAMKSLDVCCMYYDSHARFIFAARMGQTLDELRSRFLDVGLPARRLIAFDV